MGKGGRNKKRGGSGNATASGTKSANGGEAGNDHNPTATADSALSPSSHMSSPSLQPTSPPPLQPAASTLSPLLAECAAAANVDEGPQSPRRSDGSSTAHDNPSEDSALSEMPPNDTDTKTPVCDGDDDAGEGQESVASEQPGSSGCNAVVDSSPHALTPPHAAPAAESASADNDGGDKQTRSHRKHHHNHHHHHQNARNQTAQNALYGLDAASVVAGVATTTTPHRVRFGGVADEGSGETAGFDFHVPDKLDTLAPPTAAVFLPPAGASTWLRSNTTAAANAGAASAETRNQPYAVSLAAGDDLYVLEPQAEATLAQLRDKETRSVPAAPFATLAARQASPTTDGGFEGYSLKPIKDDGAGDLKSSKTKAGALVAVPWSLMRSGEMMVSKATAASLSWSASLLVVALVPVRPVAHALKDRPMMLTSVKIGLIVSCWPLLFLACLFTWPAFVAYYLSSGAEGSFKAEVRRAYATVVESLFGSPSSSSSSAMTLSS